MKVTYDGEQYTLEFNRKTATMIQRSGFNGDLLGSQPLIMIPLLVQGAFASKHPKVKPYKIDEIYENIPNKTDFIAALYGMYLETVNTLFDEEDIDEKNAATWEA